MAGLYENLVDTIEQNDFNKRTIENVPETEKEKILEEKGITKKTYGNKSFFFSPEVATIGAVAGATAGETLGAEVITSVAAEATGEALLTVEASAAGLTAVSGTAVGEGVAVVVASPKVAILAGIGAACGLAFGFDAGQWLVDKYFGDDQFDWSTDSIGGKILTYVGKNKTYVSEDLAERIKNRFIDLDIFNVFDDGPEVMDDFGNLRTKPYSVIFPEYLQASNNTYPNLTARNEALYNELINTLNGLRRQDYIVWMDSYNSGTVLTNIDGNNKISTKSKLYDSTLHKYVRRYYIDMKEKTNSWYLQLYASQDSEGNWTTSHRLTNFFRNWDRINDSFGTNLTGSGESRFPGITVQPGATLPERGKTLRETYQDWADNRVKIKTTEDEDEALPVIIPDITTETHTRPQIETQTGTQTKGEIDKIVIPWTLPNIPQRIPTKDDGTTPEDPTPTPPVGANSSGFVSLYNPTKSQLSAFSQYLWSDNFIDNFKKLFANPMDAIVGLHMIYATPSRGTPAEIVCGYAHSGVNSNTVNSQYILINCGQIKINKYFNNVLDYAPYTKIQCYLPFVGIVDIDTNEVMDGTLSITYKIDVLTGSCLARLKITRNDYSAELYNFAGNCAVQLPISGGTYSSIIANAIGVAGSIGATIASGGALAPVMVGSAVSGVTNSHFNVAHSGSLGSNAGALGIMKPYLIITRPKPAEADNYQNYYGKPTNKTVKLKNCSGFTKIKETHLEGIPATSEELEEIETILKEGVII